MIVPPGPPAPPLPVTALPAARPGDPNAATFADLLGIGLAGETTAATSPLPMPSPDRDGARRATAEMFDERGFFAGTTPAVARIDAPPAVSPADNAYPVAASVTDAAQAVPATTPLADPGPIAGTLVPTGVGPATPFLPVQPPATRTTGANAVALPPAPLRPSSRPVPQARPGSVSAPLRPAPRNSTTPVTVTLQDGEAGLHVTAKLERLDEHERERLHDQVAALLASHGLRPGGIVITTRSSRRDARQES